MYSPTVMGGFIEDHYDNVLTVYDNVITGNEVHVAIIDTVSNTIDIEEWNLGDKKERAAFDEKFGFEYSSIFDIGFKKNGTLELFYTSCNKAIGPDKKVIFANTFVNLVTECQTRLEQIAV